MSVEITDNVVLFPKDRIEQVIAERRSKEYKALVLAEDAIGILSEWFASKDLDLSDNERRFLERKIKDVLTKKV